MLRNYRPTDGPVRVTLGLPTGALELEGVAIRYERGPGAGQREFVLCVRNFEDEGGAERIKKGSFFLTTGGAPYDIRWRAVGEEPFESMLVFIELPVLRRALEEVFGSDAPHARLRDASAFDDEILNSLLGLLRVELMSRQASPLVVQGVAQVLAVHLARSYGVVDEESHGSSPSLPGHKLRQLTDWMAEHLAEECSLDRLAAKAGLSKFHLQRLFKAATGVSPSHYQLDLRMNEARRLLRETKMSVIDVALEVGYSDPSHFARLFRRETGLSPTDYCRQC